MSVEGWLVRWAWQCVADPDLRLKQKFLVGQEGRALLVPLPRDTVRGSHELHVVLISVEVLCMYVRVGRGSGKWISDI